MTRASRRARGRALVLVAFASLGAAACDTGPSGPGTITGTVVGDATLGAVVLEFRGRGVEGFEGLDDTRAYGAAVAGAGDRHRVVLVNPAGGDIRFGMRVQDLGMLPPAVVVVAAAGTDDRARSAGGIEVRLER
jgi:hypothetical protein